ncbi:type 4a pilus biogenesis protein PilO [bacterium]|nr:type 4a pilus biogenesis protein PilO [bacterium]
MNISFKDHKVQKIAAGILIFGVIFALWLTQIYTPNKEIIQEKRETLEQLNLKLSNIKLSAAKLPQLKKEVERLFIRYKLLEELMPTERDVADFVTKFNISARENNMMVRQLDVIPSEASEYYHTNPYRIVISGKYHELGSFLESIANLKFVATTKNFLVKNSSKGSETVNSEFVINAYHIKTEERLQPPSMLTEVNQSSQGAISKPTPGTKPRATEDDALSGVSGGIIPTLE